MEFFPKQLDLLVDNVVLNRQSGGDSFKFEAYYNGPENSRHQCNIYGEFSDPMNTANSIFVHKLGELVYNDQDFIDVLTSLRRTDYDYDDDMADEVSKEDLSWAEFRVVVEELPDALILHVEILYIGVDGIYDSIEYPIEKVFKFDKSHFADTNFFEHTTKEEFYALLKNTKILEENLIRRTLTL